MPKAGDHFIVELKPSHVDWGNYRYTDTREPIDGEGYIPIPLPKARSLGIYNSNYLHIGLGYNLFNCTSADGYFSGVLKAAGSRKAGDIYAKQFEGSGDLKALGRWFRRCGAKVGDHVKVHWISSTDIIIELL
jgi:hypothetical protein